MDVQRRLEALEAENNLLHEKVAMLQELLVGSYRCPVEWRLTGQEERVFGCLLHREEASKDQIMAALYANRIDDADIKIVDVFICKIRKKLKPFEIQIHTIWGRGYRLDAPTRAAILAQHSKPAAGAQ